MKQKLAKWWVAIACLAGGCLWGSCSLRGGESGKNTEGGEGVEAVTSSGQSAVEATQDTFPFPQIPAVLTRPEDRRRYLLAHYWDAFDFADTALLHKADVTEQGLVNYIDLVASHPDRQEADKAVDGFCRAWASLEEAGKVLPPLLEKYLYEPMSPLRNDALYVHFLNGLLDYTPASDARRSRWTFLRELVNRNNPGQPATDFDYYLPDGTRRTLATTPVAGKRLLLVFYDPECISCHQIIGQMKADRALARAVQEGSLSVLAIYTEGNEQVWRETLADMPEGWTVGTDRESIKNDALYDLRAMPSLYLLDKQKRVLLKDAAGTGGSIRTLE